MSETAERFPTRDHVAPTENQGRAIPRSHHYEFAHNALRTAFFAHPNEALAALTAKQELPLIDLWGKVGSRVAEEGNAVLRPRDLAVTLVTFRQEHACALVTLPRPTAEQEAYFCALVSTPRSFRYLTLERPRLLAADEEEYGLLGEWTSEGEHLDPMIEVSVSVPEFVHAVRDYIS